MPKTVLIVDDVAFVRRTLREIFTESGYQVVGEATDGAQAVDLYPKLKPDLVTMDVVMPELSGIDATRLILKGDPSARILIVSAMEQENLVMEAVNAGAKDYVLKPFTAGDLLAACEHALSSQSQPYVRTAAGENRNG